MITIDISLFLDNHYMIWNRLLLLAIALFILTGCQGQTGGAKSKVNCNDPASVKLEKTEEIELTANTTNHSGMLSNNQAKGYKFVGKKGKKISYQTKSGNLCIWLYSSGNELIKDTVLPKDDTYILQVAAETAGTFDLAMSLGSNDPSPPPATSPPSSPSPTTIASSPSPDPSPTPTTTSNSNIPTQEDARNIVSQWLEAKKRIFGSSYDKQAGERLTIGAAYERNIQARPGEEESSVDYLKGRGEYYTYDRQEVHSINSVRPISSNEALVKATITEHRTLHKRNGGLTPSQTNSKTACYLLQKDGNVWKISKDPSLLTSCS